MEIPKQLGRLLAKDRNHGIASSVGKALNDFDSWLRRNDLVFFPEFTDHGPDHIYEVMASATSLVSDTTWKKLNPEDAAALILATLVHDIGMHLRPDNFISLIDPARREEPAPQFLRSCQDPPWDLLWDEYRREASRWDEKRIRQIFGTPVPIGEVIGDTVVALRTDSEMLRDREKRLIGEFVRRHHARIAHEVSVHGVLGPDRKRLRLDVDPDLADLAGLIARSHGMPLRRAVDLLPATGRQTWRKVHVPFLMAVLRVADYLQVQAERAPTGFLKVQRLRSPVSRREWDAHHAVKDMHTEHPDPEAIVVEAAPEDGPTWLKLQRLLADVQSEVDASWAVLGEVYTGSGHSFGLTLRRVRSNLDDEEEFAASAEFIPIDARFRTADSEVLKLLVDPLYEERPEYGIRELMQNAVDAVREMEDYLAHGKHEPVDRPVQDADVVITLFTREDGSGWLEVSDRGIGMTPTTVRDYFLTAGASYRRSPAWQDEHTDESGARVLRSGRFGIGVLAAFLLGSRITVSTRHVSAPNGLTFTCSLASDEIDLRKCLRPIGTTVRVEMDADHVWDLLQEGEFGCEWRQGIDWDWWCADRPTVLRRIEPEGVVLDQSYTVPSVNFTFPEWRNAETDDSVSLWWTYWAHAPRLCCNGIQIRGVHIDRHGFEMYSDLWGSGLEMATPHLAIATPAVSVLDPDGLFPLALNRSNTVWNNPYIHDDLLESVCRDIVAYFLVNTPQSIFNSEPFHHEICQLRYPGFTRRLDDSFQVVMTPAGLTLNELSFYCEIEPSVAVLASPGMLASEVIKMQPGPTSVFLPLQGQRDLHARIRTDSPRARWKRIRLLLHGPAPSLYSEGVESSLGAFGLLSPVKRQVFVPTRMWNRAIKLRKKVLGDASEALTDQSWTVLVKKDHAAEEHEANHTRIPITPSPGESAAVWRLPKWVGPAPERSPLAQVWYETLGGSTIPYDLEERRERLASAYEELEEYIEAHEELRQRRAGVA